jgi:glutamyl-tRNA reductase
MSNVFLYNVDDLQGIVHDNMRDRAAEAERAGSLLEEDVADYLRWERSRHVGPLIGALQAQGSKVVQGEVERALKRLEGLTPEQQAVVQQLGHSVMRKLLHAPVAQLRAAARSDTEEPTESLQLADAAKALFELGTTESEPGDVPSTSDAADQGTAALQEAGRLEGR